MWQAETTGVQASVSSQRCSLLSSEMYLLKDQNHSVYSQSLYLIWNSLKPEAVAEIVALHCTIDPASLRGYTLLKLHPEPWFSDKVLIHQPRHGKLHIFSEEYWTSTPDPKPCCRENFVHCYNVHIGSISTTFSNFLKLFGGIIEVWMVWN